MKNSVKVVLATLLAAGFASQGLASDLSQHCNMRSDYTDELDDDADGSPRVNYTLPNGVTRLIKYKSKKNFNQGDATNGNGFIKHQNQGISFETLETIDASVSGPTYTTEKIATTDEFRMFGLIDGLDIENDTYNNILLSEFPNFSGGMYEKDQYLEGSVLIEPLMTADDTYVTVDRDSDSGAESHLALFHSLAIVNRINGDISDQENVMSGMVETLYYATFKDGSEDHVVYTNEGKDELKNTPEKFHLVAACTNRYSGENY